MGFTQYGAFSSALVTIVSRLTMGNKLTDIPSNRDLISLERVEQPWYTFSRAILVHHLAAFVPARQGRLLRYFQIVGTKGIISLDDV